LSDRLPATFDSRVLAVVLQVAFAASLALALSTSLAACSRVSTSSVPPNQGGIPGTLRYAINGVGSLNPLNQTNTAEVDLDMFLYGWFFYVDDHGRFVPDLATEVPSYANGGISKDGRTLVYHLRHGVKWQDGAPFDARDVIFTERAILNPRNNVFSREGWDRITSIEALDDYTVRITLKEPYAPALATFFAPYQHSGYPVLPAHLLQQYADLNQVPFNGHPVGTGPFKLKEWVRGDRVEFEANPLYWRGPPKLKRVIAKIVPDDNTILAQFESHELDAILDAPSVQYPRLKMIPGASVSLVPVSAFTLLAFNTKRPPLDDVRVRQAVAYAVDRQRIIDDVTHGVGLLGDTDIVPGSWASSTDVPRRGYDPAAARRLLRDAGWNAAPDGILIKNGERLSLNLTTIAKNATYVQIETLLQQSLRAAGIDAAVKNYPQEMVYGTAADGGVLASGRYDIALVGQNTGIDPDDSTLFMCDQVPPAGVNWTFWCDSKFDAAERAALGAYDEGSRKRSYELTQHEMAEQLPVIILYYHRLILATTDRFHGLAPTRNTIFGWNPWQWSME